MNKTSVQSAASLISFLTLTDFQEPGDQGLNAVKLEIVEQPQEHCRFRYKSEMNKMGGSHGPLYGKNSTPYAKTYPSVKLLNYDKEAKIRAKLIQSNSLFDHPHTLNDFEYGMQVYEMVPNMKYGYLAEFNNLKIINTEKGRIYDILYSKCAVRLERANKPFDIHELERICKDYSNGRNKPSMNNVRLMFSAHDPDTDQQLCKPVTSDIINNGKSAETNCLKIVKTSITRGKAVGDDEIILLVDKVQRDNIRVLFIEVQDDKIVWKEFAPFLPSDVHKQYAIICRTPPYKSKHLENDVQVFIELLRPTDGKRSDRIGFTYIANRIKDRSYSSFGSFSGSSLSSGDIPQPALMAIRGAASAPVNNEQDLQMETSILGDALQGNYLDLDYDMGDPMLSVNLNASIPAILNSNPSLPNIALDSSEFPFDDVTQMKSVDWNEYSENDHGLYREFVQQHENLVTDSGAKAKPRKSDGKENSKPVETMPTDAGKEVSIIKKLITEFCELVKNKKAGNENPIKAKLLEIVKMKYADGKEMFLHMAIATKKLLIAEVLIRHLGHYKLYEYLNAQNSARQTLLHYAILHKAKNLVPLLVANGCSPSIADEMGHNALHFAVICNSCVKELVDAINKYNIEFDFNATNKAGHTAFYLTCVHEHPEYVRLIGNYTTNIGLSESNIGPSETIIGPSETGNNESSEPFGSRTALHWAALNHNMSIMTALLETDLKNDVDAKDERGYTPLQILCGGDMKEHTLDIALMLLEKGADPAWKAGTHQSAIELCNDKQELCDLLYKYIDGVEVKVEFDMQSEVDDYETAEEEDSADSQLEGISAYENPLSQILDKSGKWRELATKLGMESLINMLAESPSPTTLLLDQVKIVDPLMTSNGIAKLLFEIDEREAGQVILDYVDV